MGEPAYNTIQSQWKSLLHINTIYMYIPSIQSQWESLLYIIYYIPHPYVHVRMHTCVYIHCNMEKLPHKRDATGTMKRVLIREAILFSEGKMHGFGVASQMCVHPHQGMGGGSLWRVALNYGCLFVCLDVFELYNTMKSLTSSLHVFQGPQKVYISHWKEVNFTFLNLVGGSKVFVCL